MSSGILHPAICSVCEAHTGYTSSDPSGFTCSKCVTLSGRPSEKSKHKSSKAIPSAALTRAAPIVADFTPHGRSGLYIYAVVVKQHPDKVKIGMTRKWLNRRRAYANWDLSAGDAILEERVFRICEDFVDLERLEAHILDTFRAPRAFGAEWFCETIDEAARHIDRIMCANGITYDL